MKQKTQTLYIFGNWKMNPVDISSAESILKEILNIQKSQKYKYFYDEKSIRCLTYFFCSKNKKNSKL